MNAHVISNPMAGQVGARSDLQRALDYLTEQGWALTLHETAAPGDTTRLAAEAAQAGAEAVVVVGGDGTLSEAANGLVGTPTALGLLPMGTGNVWAVQLGLVQSPTLIYRPDLLVAAKALTESRRQAIDLGRARTAQGERYFMLWVGIGLDAAIQHAIETEARPAKRRFGQWAYAWAAARPILRSRGTPARLVLDGRRRRERVMTVIITNIQMYASVLLAPDAKADDGWLDVCVFEGYSWLDGARHIAQLAFGRHLADPQVKFYRAREISVDTGAVWHVHYDGDPLGETPVTISAAPRALTVLVPPSAPDDWLADPSAD